MHFYKYQGAGNDFILVDNRTQVLPEEGLAGAAKRLSDRNFGVGGDGLVLIENSSKAQVKFRIFNPDGTEPEMCGNGIRCFAKHVYDFGIIRESRIRVETIAGVLEVEVVESGEVSYVRVDMGRPKLMRQEIPALGEGRIMREKLSLPSGELEISAVNTGVPHVVVFVEDLSSIDIAGLGSEVRYSSLFPEGTNVNFLEKTGRNSFKIRTYERGVEAETLACGTGAIASAVVAHLLGKAQRRVELNALGGRLFVELEGEVERAYMVGPAELVFEGDIGESKFLVGKE